MQHGWFGLTLTTLTRVTTAVTMHRLCVLLRLSSTVVSQAVMCLDTDRVHAAPAALCVLLVFLLVCSSMVGEHGLTGVEFFCQRVARSAVLAACADRHRG